MVNQASRLWDRVRDAVTRDTGTSDHGSADHVDDGPTEERPTDDHATKHHAPNDQATNGHAPSDRSFEEDRFEEDRFEEDRSEEDRLGADPVGEADLPEDHGEPDVIDPVAEAPVATTVREDGQGGTVVVSGHPGSVLTDAERFQRAVPFGVRVFAGWAWRVLAIAALVLALGYGMRYLSEVVIPLAVSILLTALLYPAARQLKKWRVPSALAAGIALLGGVIVVLGALTLIGTQIASQANSLVSQAGAGIQTLVTWVSTGPLGGFFGIKIDQDQINTWIDQARDLVTSSSGEIAGYAAELGAQIGHFAAGIAITLFSTFFFLFEGRLIWRFLLKLVPTAARRRVDEAARLGWNSLVAFVRTTVVVAFVDALGVLIAALILGVPLAPALAALVFFSAFIPLVGALVSGFVAVAIALVALGWVKALIMLACIIAVQQIETHGLQPFLMGRAVSIHPLAIILGIAIGIVVGGVVGALIAVPTMAFAKTFIAHLSISGHDIDLRRHIVV